MLQDDYFELKLVSNEQDFIYNFGVNKGHTLSFSKVNRCYFLSAEAKQLYHNICDYAWGSKRECRPSQATLRAELGWGRHSMDKYLNELRAAELILTEKRGNQQPLLYKLNELHRSQAIVHSEVVHQVREALAISGDLFHSALDIYIKAGPVITDPVRQRAEIHRWFQNYSYPDRTPAKVEEVEFPVQEDPPVRPQGMVIREGFLNQKPSTNIPKSTDVVTAADPLSTKKGKVVVDPDNAETWNSHHFGSYFSDLYKQKYGTVYQPSAADSGQLSRLIRSKPGQKESIRDAMEHFFNIDFFTVRTITSFCGNFVQAMLDQFMLTGKIPDKRTANSYPKKNQLGLAPEAGEWDGFKFQNERDGNE